MKGVGGEASEAQVTGRPLLLLWLTGLRNVSLGSRKTAQV